MLGNNIDITERKLAEKALADAKEQLERRVVERTAQLRALAGKLAQSEERERQRIAKVIHDDLQQLLVGARMHLGATLKHAEPEARQKSLEGAAQLIDKSIAVSRKLTHGLSLVVVKEDGLSAGIQSLAGWMNQHYDFTVRIHTDLVAEPSDETKAALFQSVRELLFNAVKHAGVTEAEVRLLHGSDNLIEIIVTDEGNGFDPVQAKTGFGLFSIRERLELLGGRMEVKSAPGCGCRFRLVAPLEKNEKSKLMGTPLG
jgi:signal transduction histidine kinase